MILIIVNDGLIREQVSRLLKGAGYGVQTAVSTPEALDKLAGTAVDLLLVGHQPPELDAGEWAGRTAVPVAALTMAGADVDRLRAMGVQAIIASSFDAEELLTVVGQLWS